MLQGFTLSASVAPAWTLSALPVLTPGAPGVWQVRTGWPDSVMFCVQAGVHPEQPSNTVDRAAFERIWRHCVLLLQRGFKTGSILTVDPEEADKLGRPWTRRSVSKRQSNKGLLLYHCSHQGSSPSWVLAILHTILGRPPCHSSVRSRQARLLLGSRTSFS